MTDILDDVFGREIPEDQGSMPKISSSNGHARYEAARNRMTAGNVLLAFSAQGVLETVRIESDE